jgi:hypothetical protein
MTSSISSGFTGGARASLLLTVAAILACSDTTTDAVSTGSLSGSVTGPGGSAVAGARVVVSSADGTIVPQNPAGVLTGGDGGFRVELLGFNFSQRKTTGQVTVTPPENSSLAEKVVTGVVLETGPDDPDTILDIILDEQ